MIHFIEFSSTSLSDKPYNFIDRKQMYSELKTFDDLERMYPNWILGKYVVGSHAYGLSTPSSDMDYRGIFALPTSYYLRLDSTPILQLSDEKNDKTYYTLKRFCQLALSGNPNIIELLFMPDDCRVIESPLMTPLLERRQDFVTLSLYETHVQYANAQIHRAKGKNKRVNHPFTDQPPQQEEFCWFVPRVEPNGRFPFRPLSLKDTNLPLERCRCAVVEHVENLYRLYEFDDCTGGVFKNNQIACSSIAKSDESRCIGLLIFHQNAYQKQNREFHDYWEWRNKRNESRWISQETGERNYDAKNMMHTIRLLMSAERFMTDGVPMVRVTGADRDYLMNVRNGQYSWEELTQHVEQKLEYLRELKEKSTLPQCVSNEKIESLNDMIAEISQQIQL